MRKKWALLSLEVQWLLLLQWLFQYSSFYGHLSFPFREDESRFKTCDDRTRLCGTLVIQILCYTGDSFFLPPFLRRHFR